MFRRITRLLLLLAALAPLVSAGQAAPLPGSSLAQKLQKDYETRHARFAAQVEAIAAEPDVPPDEARRLQDLARQPDPRALQSLELPETLVPDLPSTLPPAERNRLTRLKALEADYATDLFRQGQRARTNAQIPLAWRLIREAAHRNPDHTDARKALGFVLYQNVWMSPFKKQMLERGFVWHDSFGWVEQANLPKYLQGLRPAPDGQWLQADRVAAIRAYWPNGWQVNSEHFHVHSNHSLERAVEISVSLERFYDFFIREFAPVFMTPQQMHALFEGAGGVVGGRRHIVHYYRTRDEFKQRLVEKQPEAAFSDGMYMPGDRIAYFFDRPGESEKVAETMYHEVTHQILTESPLKTVKKDNWTEGDFWLVEGLACYLESFQPQGKGWTVGDPAHVRVDWARRFRVDENYFIPLERFTAMSQHDFQCSDMLNGPERLDRLQHHYAQAAGVTHFLMHAGEGRYRDALVQYLAEIYSADSRIRRNNRTLADLAGVPFEELDRQYLDYMRGLGAPTRTAISPELR